MPFLAPVPTIGSQDLARAQHHLVRDAAGSAVATALSGGVVLAGLALTLGAGPLTLGLLSAIPFLAQAVQLPTTLVVERWRMRKRLGVIGLTAGRLLILSLSLVPLGLPADAALVALVVAQAAISVCASFGLCHVNSWLHQLLPSATLGSFFARRLATGVVAGGVVTLAVGRLLEHPPEGQPLRAYALALALAGAAGLFSSWHLAQAPEPRMTDAGPPGRLRDRLRAPFHDRGFRRLLVLLGSWNLASNLSAPFLTVYLIRQLGLGMGTVTALWVTSQAANALTLLAWGRVSDRTSNKSILAVAFPAYFACALGLVFTRLAEPFGAQVAWLFVVHAVMGAATGGITLATGNLGLKLAPQGQGTPYLAAVGLVSAVAGGAAPLIGGALAQWLASSQLSLVLRWSSAAQVDELAVLSITHLEFLFAGTAALGLYVLHALTRLEEGGEVSERRVVQELALEALRSVNQLSSIGGVLGGVFTFDRLNERRRGPRRGEASRGAG